MVHAFRLRTPFQAAAVFLEQARCKNIHAKILRISEQYTHPLVALYFPPDSIGIPPPFARHLETGEGIAWLFSPNFIESSGISSAHKKYRPQTSALWAGIAKGGALKVIFRIRIFCYSMLMVEFNLPKKNEMNVFSFPE